MFALGDKLGFPLSLQSTLRRLFMLFRVAQVRVDRLINCEHTLFGLQLLIILVTDFIAVACI